MATIYIPPNRHVKSLRSFPNSYIFDVSSDDNEVKYIRKPEVSTQIPSERFKHPIISDLINQELWIPEMKSIAKNLIMPTKIPISNMLSRSSPERQDSKLEAFETSNVSLFLIDDLEDTITCFLCTRTFRRIDSLKHHCGRKIYTQRLSTQNSDTSLNTSVLPAENLNTDISLNPLMPAEDFNNHIMDASLEIPVLNTTSLPAENFNSHNSDISLNLLMPTEDSDIHIIDASLEIPVTDPNTQNIESSPVVTPIFAKPMEPPQNSDNDQILVPEKLLAAKGLDQMLTPEFMFDQEWILACGDEEWMTCELGVGDDIGKDLTPFNDNISLDQEYMVIQSEQDWDKWMLSDMSFLPTILEGSAKRSWDDFVGDDYETPPAKVAKM